MEKAEGQTSWAGVIRAWADADQDHLRRSAEEVAEMVQQPGWDVLRKLLNDQIAARLKESSSIRVLDHTAYVAINAEIRAFKMALDAPGVLLAINRDEGRKRQKSVEQTQPETAEDGPRRNHGRFRISRRADDA